jgi:hypothetical protein
LIEKGEILAAMSLYIHGEPLLAQIVKDLFKYRWSSYKGYVNKGFQNRIGSYRKG